MKKKKKMKEMMMMKTAVRSVPDKSDNKFNNCHTTDSGVPKGLLQKLFCAGYKSICKSNTGCFFLTGPTLKVLSVRLRSKLHQKSSKCQNLVTEQTCDF